MRRAERRPFGFSSGGARRRAAAWALLLLGAATAACGGAPAGPGPAMTAAERRSVTDSVTALVQAWREAVVSLDTTRLGQFYSTDSTFRWIEDGRLRYGSGAELLAAWRGTVPGVKAMDLILDQLQVTPLAPGVAAVTMSFVQRVTDTAGQQGGFAGATTLVAVRTAEGWRFLLGHTSAAGPPGSRP